tara:strand:+ start:560 stop:1621 length:1062 start_codon:yes stop_codon:yes gene_type:complete
MNKIKLIDYKKTILKIIDRIDSFPKYLRPVCIVQNGHIEKPGISDIDLMIGFDDEFLFANEFLKLFEKEILNLKHKDIFFSHLPNIFPISCLESMPEMTYNPINELEIHYGKLKFKKKSICNDQNALNSLEQIHNRITMLIELMLSKNKNINKLLLFGHSMIHSIKYVKNIDKNINIKKFPYLDKIEKFRDLISNEGIYPKLSKEEFDEMCINLCFEFFTILSCVYSYLDKKIYLHFSKNKDHYFYNNHLIFTNLEDYQNNDFKININENKIYIQGFRWHIRCVFENYFLSHKNYTTIYNDIIFEKKIFDRALFIKTLYTFNLKNFNNAVGRSSINPLVKGNKYDEIVVKNFL